MLKDLKAGASHFLSIGAKPTLAGLLGAAGMPLHQFYIHVRLLKTGREAEKLDEFKEVFASVGLNPRVLVLEAPEEDDDDDEWEAAENAGKSPSPASSPETGANRPEGPRPDETPREKPPARAPVTDQDAWNTVVDALRALSPSQRSRVIASVQIYFDV